MRRSRGKKKKEKSEDPSLIVKMGFTNRKQIGGKTRVRNTISKQRQELKKVTAQNEEIQRKYKSLLRRHQRLQVSTLKKTKQSQNQSSSKTPRSKASTDLTSDGITPSNAPNVRRKLTNAYALMEEVKDASKNMERASKKVIETIVEGNILRKYRSMRKIAKETKLNRHNISKALTKNVKERKKQRAVVYRRMISRRVEEFLTRDENSRVFPDKGEVKRMSACQLVAKRTFTDYLENLHHKFCSEYLDIKISRARFFFKKHRK